MTAIRKHLAVLRSSMERTEGLTDHLAEHIRAEQRCSGGSCKQGRRQCETPEACQIAERAEERADAGAYFLAAVILAVLAAITTMHLWSAY